MNRGIKGFSAKRLLQALAVRRLTQVQLAAMVGVSPSTVSKWKSEQQAPEPVTLARLASIVNVSPEWFTRGMPGEVSEPLFRSNASAHVGARGMLQARLEWAHDIAVALSHFADFPEVVIPTRSFTDPDQITSADIESAAADCRDLWRLGQGPIPDLALALESAGVILVREETGVPQIEGLSSWSKPLARPFVLLSADKDNGFRSRFDAAHELGHLVLHKHVPKETDRKRHNDMERQAHRFAGALLLPAESFSSEIRTPVTLDSLLLLKQRWGVSVGAMIMRLEALRIIDADVKLGLFKRRSARWGAKSEPGDEDRLPEKPRLLRRTVELLLSSNVMARETMPKYLGISARDIEMLAGLPESYFSATADVVQLARLRGESDSAKAGVEVPSVSGNVVPFARRAR